MDVLNEQRHNKHFKGGGGSREQTPTTTTDVNFNSPEHHRSSQDGSFIQEEDMHLILEFGPPKFTNEVNQLSCSADIVSNSWRGRNAEWATNFDTNVAELDFDDFSASRDISSLKGGRYSTSGVAVSPTKIFDLQKSINADCNHNNRLNKRLLMRDSMDVSLGGGSMFSSNGAGLLCDENALIDQQRCRDLSSSSIFDDFGQNMDENQEALLFNRANGGALAFISADSLDFSSLSAHEETLKAVCKTKKREYVLTFDKNVAESGVGAFSSKSGYESVEASNYDNVDMFTYPQAELIGDDELTTWCRVKRSYEMGDGKFYVGNSKCTSLPNLLPSPTGPQRLFVRDGAEEKMISKNDEECQQIVSPTENNSNGAGGERFSLLKAFQSKNAVSPLKEDNSLAVPPAPVTYNGRNVNTNGSNDSSGYATGSGSQHYSNNNNNNNQSSGEKYKSATSELPKIGKLTSCDNDSNSFISCGGEEDKNNQSDEFRPDYVHVSDSDYEYAEFFVNGRYIDVNHNEIGYVPPSTTGVQQTSAPLPTTMWASTVSVRNKQHNQENSPRRASSDPPPPKPPRTFATLLEQNGVNLNDYVVDGRTFSRQQHRTSMSSSSDLRDSATQVPVYVVDQGAQTAAACDGGKLVTTVSIHPDQASTSSQPFDKVRYSKSNRLPDLGFLKFPFELPPMNLQWSPFLAQFLGESQTVSLTAGLASPTMSSDKQKNFSGFNAGSTNFAQFQHQANNPFAFLPDPPKLATKGGRNRRDSGLAGLAEVNGPAHIQDWESLALLLPKNVVETCSFFKANTNLLGNIDKPATSPRGRLSPRGAESISILKRCKNRFDSIAEEDDERVCCRKTVCRNDIKSNSCDHHRCECQSRKKLYCCEPPVSKISRCCPNSTRMTSSAHGRSTWTHHTQAEQQHGGRSCHGENCLQEARSRHRCCDTCQSFEVKCGPWVRSFSEESEGEPFELNFNGDMYTSRDLFRRSEFICRPEVDLTGVRKFYSLPTNDLVGGEPFLLDERANEHSLNSAKPCATCYRVRSPSSERRFQEFFCDCRTSDVVVEDGDTRKYQNGVSFSIIIEDKPNDEERRRRRLKENVDLILESCKKIRFAFGDLKQSVEIVADDEVCRKLNSAVEALVFNSLCPSIEMLLVDGLICDDRCLWTVVRTFVLCEPHEYKEINDTIKQLDESKTDPRERSLQFAAFVNGLLKSHLLDVWFSVFLRQKDVLTKNYGPLASIRQMSVNDVVCLLDEMATLKSLPFDKLQQNQAKDEHLNSAFSPKRRNVDVLSMNSELHVGFFKPKSHQQSSRNEVVKDSTESTTIKSTNMKPIERQTAIKSIDSKRRDVVQVVNADETLIQSNCVEKPSPIIDGALSTSKAGGTPTRKSRIPTMKTKTSPKHSAVVPKFNLTLTKSRSNKCKQFAYDNSYVCTVEQYSPQKANFLSFDAGETLTLLEEYCDENILRCERGGAVGLVPRDKVTFLTFL